MWKKLLVASALAVTLGGTAFGQSCTGPMREYAEAQHGVLTEEHGPEPIPGKPVKVEHYLQPREKTSIERSSKDPDCGSSDTQSLVAQIAKDHPGNKLTNFILQNSQAVWAQAQQVPSSKLLEQ